MEIITRSAIVAEVPQRFRDQYATYPRSHRFAFGTVAEVLEKLERAKTEADIVAALPHWCNLTCEECDEDRERLVRFGDRPDYEARWWDVCEGCLRKATELVGRSEGQ